MLWLGLVLAGAAAFALSRIFVGYPPSRFSILTRGEAAFTAAAADALFPHGGEIPESGVEAGIPAYLDRYLAAMPIRQRLLMHALFLLIENATFFFPGPGPRGWRRFSSLSPDQQVAVLEGWRTSSLFPRRMVFLALRSLLTMGYFACPAVLRRTGLTPPDIATPVVEADLLYPRVGRPRSEIRYGPADLTRELPLPGGPDAPAHPDYREDAP